MPVANRNIFGRRQQVVKEAYTSDQFSIAITGGQSLRGNGSGDNFILVQGVEINTSQNVTRLFDLENAEYMAFIGSRPEGNMSLNGAITNFDQMIDFTQEYGDVCKVVGNSETGGRSIFVEISSKDDDVSCNFEGGALTLMFPVLVSQNLAVRVQDYVISSAMQLIFADLRPGGNGQPVST